MSRAFVRSIFSFPVFLGAALAAIVFQIDNSRLPDPDIWWHLRNAEYLLKTHHFIRADMYSYTVTGASWINHEWLAEIPYYLAWRAWGLRGLFLVMIVLLETVMLGTYALGRLVSGNAKSAFVASWLAVLMATVSFGPRTLLFGWICLLALLAVLWSFKNKRRDLLWLLPPLFLLWVNLHGSWLIGMAVLWIFILTGLVEFSGPALESVRWTRPELRRLLIVAGTSLLVVFLNPYGHRLVLYPFDLALGQKLNVANIQEWASPDFHVLRGKILLGSIFLTLTMVLVRRQRLRLEWFLLFLLGIYASVTYGRFLFLAAIIFTPILASSLDMIPSHANENEKDKPFLNGVLIAAAIAFMIWRFPAEHDLSVQVEALYPTRAVSFVKQRSDQEPGRVFNLYVWGGYFILNCRDVPVFIDPRVDIFEHRGVFRDYLDVINLNGSLEVLDKYGVRYVVLDSHSAQAYFLDHVPQWHATYRDDVAIVFERSAEILHGVPVVAPKN
jgi:hypothetical protein